MANLLEQHRYFCDVVIPAALKAAKVVLPRHFYADWETAFSKLSDAPQKDIDIGPQGKTPNMIDMVERVARAFRAETMVRGVDPGPCWDLETESIRETYRGMARAAIKAMREPTEAMLIAARSAQSVGTYALRAEFEYPAMIDAALK